MLLSKCTISQEDFERARPVVQSYLGMLSHCKGEKVRTVVEKLFEKWR